MINLRKKPFPLLIDIGAVCTVMICTFIIASNTTYNSAPDEYMRYYLCQFMYMNFELPNGLDRSIADSSWGFSYAFSPFLGQILSALLMRFVSLFETSPQTLIIAARCSSVIFVTGYAVFCVLISRILFKKNYLRILFVTFCVLLPQILYLGSYVNNDSVALFSVSLIVYAWLLGLKNDWNWASCIVLSIGVSVCFLSYYNAYGYILCSAIIFIASFIIKKKSFKEFIAKCIVMILIVSILSGWFFVRNYLLYDGDILGISTQRYMGETYGSDTLKPSSRVSVFQSGRNILGMLFGDMRWVQSSIESFIGIFGYMSLPMNAIILRAYVLLYVVGFIGIIVAFVLSCCKKLRVRYEKLKLDMCLIISNKENLLLNIVFIICICIPILLSISYSYFNDFQAQGRYVICISIPFFYFITLGMQTWFNIIFKDKEAIKKFICVVLCIFQLVIACYAVFFIISNL